VNSAQKNSVEVIYCSSCGKKKEI